MNRTEVIVRIHSDIAGVVQGAAVHKGDMDDPAKQLGNLTLDAHNAAMERLVAKLQKEMGRRRQG